MELTEEKREEVLQESIPPMGFRMIAREFVKEKMAMFSLILFGHYLISRFYRFVSVRPKCRYACKYFR